MIAIRDSSTTLLGKAHSTLEHNLITCLCSFVRTVQHHRHRTWSYNEISRRYTDVNIQFYEPNEFRTQHKSNRQASNVDEVVNPVVYRFEDGGETHASSLISRHHEHSLRLFEDLISSGVCREQARGVLPQNMYTEYYGTVNLSNLLKFVELRTHDGAQWEIQKSHKPFGNRC